MKKLSFFFSILIGLQTAVFCQLPLLEEIVTTRTNEIKKISKYSQYLPYEEYADSLELENQIDLPNYPKYIEYYDEPCKLTRKEYYNNEGQMTVAIKFFYQDNKLIKVQGIGNSEYEYFDKGLVKITTTDKTGQKGELGYINNKNGQILYEYAIVKDTSWRKYYYYNEKDLLVASTVYWKNGTSTQTFNVYDTDGSLLKILFYNEKGKIETEKKYVKINDYESHIYHTDHKNRKRKNGVTDEISIIITYRNKDLNVFKEINYSGEKSKRLYITQYVYEYRD